MNEQEAIKWRESEFCKNDLDSILHYFWMIRFPLLEESSGKWVMTMKLIWWNPLLYIFVFLSCIYLFLLGPIIKK